MQSPAADQALAGQNDSGGTTLTVNEKAARVRVGKSKRRRVLPVAEFPRRACAPGRESLRGGRGETTSGQQFRGRGLGVERLSSEHKIRANEINLRAEIRK